MKPLRRKSSVVLFPQRLIGYLPPRLPRFVMANQMTRSLEDATLLLVESEPELEVSRCYMTSLQGGSICCVAAPGMFGYVPARLMCRCVQSTRNIPASTILQRFL